MKNTKIETFDSTLNAVMGCPNGCEYCYARKLNTRFKWIEDWSKPQFFPERLKDFYSKKPKSIFIDSMSDIGTWKQEWLNAVLKAINDNPQHRYIALTKRLDLLVDKLNRSDAPVVNNLWIGTSVTTQAQADKYKMLDIWIGNIAFFSIEPILEPIQLPCMPKTLIIGAETGNRKGKVIPQKEWITSLVAQADKHNCVVFMKESLRKIMGDDFRQDKLPWEIEKMTNREYLNSLPNDKFTDLVLAKQAELSEKNFDPEADIFDITDGARLDFEKWLEEEHTENADNES